MQGQIFSTSILLSALLINFNGNRLNPDNMYYSQVFVTKLMSEHVAAFLWGNIISSRVLTPENATYSVSPISDEVS